MLLLFIFEKFLHSIKCGNALYIVLLAFFTVLNCHSITAAIDTLVHEVSRCGVSNEKKENVKLVL